MSKTMSSIVGPESIWKDKFELICKQMVWAKGMINKGAKLCKDSWDRAHLRTISHALDIDHPLIKAIEKDIMEATGHITTVAAERKALPIARGVLDYFPDALVAVAKVSLEGNRQHNPGQPLHWAKEKSTDEADALLRHLIDRGKLDADGQRHSAKVAWRALALLQREIEGEHVDAGPK